MIDWLLGLNIFQAEFLIGSGVAALLMGSVVLARYDEFFHTDEKNVRKLMETPKEKLAEHSIEKVNRLIRSKNMNLRYCAIENYPITENNRKAFFQLLAETLHKGTAEWIMQKPEFEKNYSSLNDKDKQELTECVNMNVGINIVEEIKPNIPQKIEQNDSVRPIHTLNEGATFGRSQTAQSPIVGADTLIHHQQN